MTPQDQVWALIAAWEARDVEAILARLTPDALYHNVGLPPAQGHDAIRQVITPFLAGATRVEWSVHHMAQTPAGVVLTERTDRFEFTDKTLSIAVMGAFEFEGDQIRAWRDYFDVPGFLAQMGG